MATAAAAKTPTKPLAPAASSGRTPTKPLAPAAAKTPAKTPCPSRVRSSHASENSNPNIPGTPPPSQSTTSKPVLKSPSAAGARSAASKKKPSTPAPAAPPPTPRERGRRFIVAKKATRRRRNVGSVGGGGGEIDFDKCREAAREALRASQDEFFRKELATSTVAGEEQLGQEVEEKAVAVGDAEVGAFEEGQEERNEAELEGSNKVRAMRTKAMSDAMASVPDPGSGRVKHLVQAFEGLLTISGATSDADRAGEGSWALPGLQQWKEGSEGDPGLPAVSVSLASDFLNEGADRLSSSLDGLTDRLSRDSRTSAGGRRSRRNSSESLRSSWNKKLKVTSQHPFKLRTEQRGRFKEQQFIEKVQTMLLEEEKKRIHIAQGLPWTTDEPECLIKPAVKERTEPVDLVLHSDVRALERAEFDQHVLEKNRFAEQQKLEWERQQELEEQEMIRQLRRTELIPKAQPMPYFDRPFIPKRSSKPATIPVEPKFHPRPEKLSCNAWSMES